MNWKFHKYAEDEKQSNSSSEKSFKSQELAQSLIRETVQNSLDASNESSNPVEVHIRIIEVNFTDVAPYLASIEQHYKACGLSIDNRCEQITFLIIEDFQTVGLNGDKLKSFFLRDNIRLDTKQGGGSHGIGKIVLYLASHLRTFFAYSLFNGGQILEGTAHLKTHELDSVIYREHGRLQLQCDEHQDFIKTLFTREKNQYGLSIAIPFLSKDISTDSIKKEVLNQFYYPILNDKLQVFVESESIDSDVISKNNKLSDRYHLIKEYLKNSDSNINVSIEIKNNTNFEESIDESIHKTILEKIHTQQKLILDITLTGFVKNSLTKGFLTLLFCTKSIKEEGQFDYWRGHLLITDASKRKNISKDYVAIVIVNNNDDNELHHFLRKLENPAHTEWEYQNPESKIKKQYLYIANVVTFVSTLPQKIIKLIKSENRDIDSNLFADLFPMDGLNQQNNEPKNTTEQQKSTKPRINIDEPIPSDFIFSKLSDGGGFTITLNKNTIIDFHRVSIKIAYKTNYGDAFKNYDIRDFDLSQNLIKIDINNGAIEERVTNFLTLVIADEDFRLSLSGFDPDRELTVEIKIIE